MWVYGVLQRIIQGIKNITTLITVYIQIVSNSVYHNINTRQRNYLHLRSYYSGIKIFNGLPKAIKDISSKPKKFKIALKHFLHTHSFYSLDEFFNKQ